MRIATPPATPLASWGWPFARLAVLGGPAVSASFTVEANFSAMKLPVAPLSMRMTTGWEPINPRSLMSELLGGAAGDRASARGSTAATTLREGGPDDRRPLLDSFSTTLSCNATETSWKVGSTHHDGPGSWPESGRMVCPRNEKRFDVVIFSAGLTEKTAWVPLGSHAWSVPSVCSGNIFLRHAASRCRWP
jgi:hypothetical protein